MKDPSTPKGLCHKTEGSQNPRSQIKSTTNPNGVASTSQPTRAHNFRKIKMDPGTKHHRDDSRAKSSQFPNSLIS